MQHCRLLFPFWSYCCNGGGWTWSNDGTLPKQVIWTLSTLSCFTEFLSHDTGSCCLNTSSTEHFGTLGHAPQNQDRSQHCLTRAQILEAAECKNRQRLHQAFLSNFILKIAINSCVLVCNRFLNTFYWRFDLCVQYCMLFVGFFKAAVSYNPLRPSRDMRLQWSLAIWHDLW